MTRSSVVAAGTSDQVGLDLAREMRRRWRGGERPAAEEFLSASPGACHRPEAAVELIYEEFCLRQSAGEQGVEQDLLRRFPQWAGPLRVMLDCHHRLLESDEDRPDFPDAGEVVGEFRLVAELFRGRRARVFLAEQIALADRAVVLKITALDGGEHVSLARLQHTHIVPLYSVVDDASRNIRVLCMPYFGRATLASVLDALRDVPPAARTGRDLVEAIDRLQCDASPPATAAAGPRQVLEQVPYAQGMCWIAAALADALRFAHERGLVHLDLKPANVLLAADGQPMLLDFHLAREPVTGYVAAPENLGGTPMYMAPEQKAAMRALRAGEPVEAAVDARADLYAFGAMLYEALGGRLPVDAASPPLSRVNAAVSVGLSDIVARCLAPRPEGRYADAAGLANDLRRHLADEPLAGVPNRSIAERWHKWRRRRPGAARAALAAAALFLALATLAAGAWTTARDRGRQAETAMSDGERQLAAGQFAEAVRSFERGVSVAEGLPFHPDVRRQALSRLAIARQVQLAHQLREAADHVRALYGSESIAAERLASLESQCRALWQQRDVIRSVLGATHERETAEDLTDIAIFATGARASRTALELLDEVERVFGPSAVLAQERRLRLAALGLPDPSKASPPTPRTAWEHYALGRAYLASDDLARAAGHLAAAQKLDPAGRWTNFYYGLCAHRSGHYESAVAAFSVCIGATPNVAACYYNRALAHEALDRHWQAMQDCDSALRIDPGYEPALRLRSKIGAAEATSRFP